MFVVFSMPPGSAMYLMCGMSRNPKWFLLVLLIGRNYPCTVPEIPNPPEKLPATKVRYEKRAYLTFSDKSSFDISSLFWLY